MKAIHRTYPLAWKMISVLPIFASAVILSACAPLPPRAIAPSEATRQALDTQPPTPAQELLYEWSGNGRSISRIEIDVDEQKAVFYDGPRQIGWSMVASGIDFFSTPRGRFRISEKVADKRSNLYGKIYDSRGKLVAVNARRGVHRIPPGGTFEGAKMPYFMRLTKSGVGMHAGAIPEPGSPASHGCVRLPRTLAPVLYEHVKIGTPVRIVGS